jgi:hypothetical protein
MTLRGFLDACYALLVEDFQRVNPLMDADSVHDRVRSALGGSTDVPAAPKKEDVAAKNQQAMAALKMMMGAVKGSPV